MYLKLENWLINRVYKRSATQQWTFKIFTSAQIRGIKICTWRLCSKPNCHGSQSFLTIWLYKPKVNAIMLYGSLLYCLAIEKCLISLFLLPRLQLQLEHFMPCIMGFLLSNKKLLWQSEWIRWTSFQLITIWTMSSQNFSYIAW